MKCNVDDPVHADNDKDCIALYSCVQVHGEI